MTDEEQQDTRESPIAADRRAAATAPSSPIGPIVGAFLGAFAAAKVLKRLRGGSD